VHSVPLLSLQIKQTFAQSAAVIQDTTAVQAAHRHQWSVKVLRSEASHARALPLRTPNLQDFGRYLKHHCEVHSPTKHDEQEMQHTDQLKADTQPL
jgi:hypothetical protein